MSNKPSGIVNMSDDLVILVHDYLTATMPLYEVGPSTTAM
jgi:hypothetical protein